TPRRQSGDLLSATMHPLFPLFFFSLLRPPPRPPLFPYTTLFRSRLPTRAGEAHRAGRLDATGAEIVAELLERWPALAPEARVRLDRKSTRLNSSHVSISYAVFCLKKKKKKITY